MTLQKLIIMKSYISMKDDYTVYMREIIPPPTTKNRSSHTTRFPLFGCTSRLQSNHDSTRYHKHGLLDFYARLYLDDPIETQISNFLRYI